MDPNAFLWDAHNGDRLGALLKGNAGWPVGRQIVSGTEVGWICLWNARIH
ncbi:hypothetical protein M404DRAFT_997019 [Pisolithus tinctorius Marx 270]|uniref:Uncharacterized protein n=1 Tax=Pisolithus tinctorius Marx 270 TaxID=870435 RepID=A0A0C3P6A3_PISTI|nr:hypothetical protein M404DRAFT_997019 [Pisolithus tinctorius Marx 270]